MTLQRFGAHLPRLFEGGIVLPCDERPSAAAAPQGSPLLSTLTLLPQLRLALLHGSHHHVTHASSRQPVQAPLDALHGDDVEVLGTYREAPALTKLSGKTLPSANPRPRRAVRATLRPGAMLSLSPPATPPRATSTDPTAAFQTENRFLRAGLAAGRPLPRTGPLPPAGQPRLRPRRRPRSPVLSAQLITAPTGRPREMRNFAPEEPPRPAGRQED